MSCGAYFSGVSKNVNSYFWNTKAQVCTVLSRMVLLSHLILVKLSSRSFPGAGVSTALPWCASASLASPAQPCSEVSHGPGHGALWGEGCECSPHVKGTKAFPLLSACLSASSLYIPRLVPWRAWIIVSSGFVLQEEEFIGSLMHQQIICPGLVFL